MENENHLKIVADGTYGYDFTRVKMGLSTYGYYPLFSKMHTFSRNLFNIDLKLGYIQEEYGDITISNYVNELYSSLSVDKNPLSFQSDEFLIMRMKEIKALYDTYTNINQFYDLQHCASYLQMHILREDYEKVKEISLVQRDKNLWEFMTIFSVELRDDMLYYALQKDKDHYIYQEISKSDATYYTNHMQGKNKEFIYHK